MGGLRDEELESTGWGRANERGINRTEISKDKTNSRKTLLCTVRGYLEPGYPPALRFILPNPPPLGVTHLGVYCLPPSL